MDQEERVRLARRDTLAHAMGILGVAADRQNWGVGLGAHIELKAARDLIVEGGIAGEPGSDEHRASAEERAAVVRAINDALEGSGTTSGLDPLTWAEKAVHARLVPLLFRRD